jgi:hypothetical protein
MEQAKTEQAQGWSRRGRSTAGEDGAGDHTQRSEDRAGEHGSSRGLARTEPGEEGAGKNGEGEDGGARTVQQDSECSCRPTVNRLLAIAPAMRRMAVAS